MAHNGGPRVPPRPPPTSLAGVHTTSSRNIPPPPPPVPGVTPGNGVRAPATMSVSLPPVTAPLSPLGSRHSHHHRLAPPGSVARRVSPVRNENTNANTPTTPVSLTSPRPDGERVTNEYVETPFARNAGVNSTTQLISSGVTSVDHNINSVGTLPTTPQSTTVNPLTQSITKSNNHQTSHLHHHHRPETLPLPATVITKQPQATFTKSHRSVLRPDSVIECHTASGVVIGTRTPIGSNPGSVSGSIICPECGRCRCESCQQPRPLPQRWVCDKKCLCSVDAIIDYTSCLCCVKGLYYHCSKDYELDRDGDGVSCADEPCSCSPHRRMVRWGCLLALTAALPCLLCYWPLRGCARGIEMIYAQHTRSGCRCRPPSSHHPHLASSVHHHQQDTLTTPEKRLLDSSPDF